MMNMKVSKLISRSFIYLVFVYLLFVIHTVFKLGRMDAMTALVG